jgi:glycosyltransferase involved in cell wall biosynthesis
MEFLLRSFEIVLKHRNDSKLYLVGGSVNPSDIEFLRSEAKKLNIEHAVTITGFLPQKEAWQHVKEANVCVSPIYPSPVFDVGSPTKLLEYMGMGKASVANDHPEQQVVLSESKAGICVPYDEVEFAKAIIYLIENQDIAREMGISGRKYIEEKRNYSQTSIFVEQKLLSIAMVHSR